MNKKLKNKKKESEIEITCDKFLTTVSKKKKLLDLKTVCDKFLKTLNKKQKAEFDKRYKEFLVSEIFIASMEKDKASETTKKGKISSKIIRHINAAANNITMKNFNKIMNVLGYSLLLEKNDDHIPVDLLYDYEY